MTCLLLCTALNVQCTLQILQHIIHGLQAAFSCLVRKKSIDGVDRISGATIAYDQFTEAVNNALSQAEQ